MKDIDRDQFGQDLKEGLSTNALAKKHGLQWKEAKDLRAELEGHAEPPSAPAEEDAETGNYEIKVDIPAERLMDLIRGIELDEIMLAIERLDAPHRALILQSVMQRKFEELLQPKAIQMPTLVGHAG